MHDARTMKTLQVCVFTAALAIGACNKDKGGEPAQKTAANEPAKTDPAAPEAKKEPAATPTDSASVDHSDPVKVTEAIFAAAAAGKHESLAGLCAPDKGDGDVKDICGATAGAPKWGEFVESFAKGKVSGPARVEGDRAEVDFMFGPDGSKKETMKLEKTDGKWYLASF